MLQDRKPSLVTRRKLASQLRHRRDVARRLTVETLESRQLLAGFVSGSIQGQDNWSGGSIAISPNVVQTVDQSGSNAHAGIGAWRVSNSTANGGYNGNFNGWPFSAPLSVAAGQPSSLAGADQFNATFFFKAGSSVADGSNIEVDLGTTGGDDRNTFLAITNDLDANGGLKIRAAEPDGVTGDFLPTQIVATGLSRTAWHRIEIVAKFYNGNGNDTFQISLDGNVLTNPLTAGTTFGTFEGFRNGLGSPYVLSNRLFWRSGASPSAYDSSFSDSAAQGFFFDDVSYSVSQQSAPSTLLASYSAAFEPVGATVNTSYVKNSWVGTPLGVDPDGAGPATAFGYDAFASIQAGIDGTTAGGTVNVLPGTYVENVLVNKNLSLLSTGGRAVTTIQGISGLGSLGAVQIAPTTTAFQLGDTNKGFTVIGIDNGAPGIENAAVYFQGNHSNAIIRGNDIRANGDEGFTTEFGATISGFIIDGNIFSGKSFVGPNPDGLGTSQQFTLPNVPRPLVVIGGGTGGGNTSNITFTNNQITGTTGGLNTLAQEQGNLLVALDSNGATISGNTFQGTTSRNGVYSLRTRGPNTVVSGNSFFSTGLTPSVGHLLIQGTGQTIDAAFAANTFDTGVYVSGTNPGVIFSTLQSAIDAVAAGTTIQVPTDTYVENITINKNLTLNFAPGAAIQPVAGDALTITAGTTKIAGTVNTGVRPTIVATGATLGGTGKITGPVTVQSGGFMSPGNSPGIISTGNYNQVGTLNIEIVNPATPPVAGTDYDQVDVTGTVTLTGALSVTLSGTLPVSSGTSFKIINNDDVDAVVGNFTGLVNGSTFLVGAQNFAIFYNGGDGNDVVLVAVTTLVPTVVYVEDTQWNGFVNGQAITDADFGTSGNQLGVFGYSAFKTIAAAQAAVAPGGTIVVRDGSYSEAVSLSGTLAMRLTGATELGAGSVTINSLTGVSANSLALGVVGSAASLVVGDATSTAYAGTITGPGAITKTGTGTLSLTNSSSSYTGNTILNLGTLSVPDVANSGANSPIGAGTTIQFGGGALDFTAAGVDSSNRAISLTANGGVSVSNAAGALTLTGAVTGNTQFTKFGPGTMSWQPATAAISNLHISGGVLELDGSGTFSIGTILPGSSTGDGALATGSGTLNIKGAVVVNASNISGNNQSSTTGTINQSGTSDVNVSGMVRIGHWPNGGMGNYNLSAGTLDLTGSPGAQVNQGAVAEQNGVIYLGIDGSGSLTVTGGAITATAIVLDGRGDTAGTDTFTLSGGTVTLGNSSNATTIANSGIFVGNNNTNTTYQVNLGGAGGTLRAATNITSAVKMTLVGSGANAINIDTNGNSINLAGTLSGSGDLKKTGAGTLTLSNVVNTYTGVTTVNAGTLLINGAIANGAATDDVVVNSAGVLGGTGTINGAVLVNSGGTITAGTLGGVGTLTIISNLSFNGGTYGADFSTNSSDTLVVGGVIDLANAAAGAFAVNSQTGTPADGNVFTLINNTAGGAIIDPPLAGATEGASVAIGGKTSYYTYTGGDGNNFTLTVVGGPTLAGAGALEVRRVINGLGDNIQLLQAGVIIDSRPLSGITGSYTVNGTSAADSLLINYTNTAPASGFIPLNINFNGGIGGTDTLRILGGSFDLINHTFANANNGSILMDPTVGTNTTITYTGLEPVLMNVGTVTDVIFNLPVGADTAILEDDTELVANTSQIRSVVGPTFERTTFTHPTGSLTVNGGASDIVQINFSESLTAANFVVAGVTTIQAGNVVTTGNVTLTATGAISEYLPDGTADITANLLTMTAATGIDVDTAINTLSANNTTSGAVLVDDVGPLVINKLRNVDVVASRVSATGHITDSGIDTVDMAGFTRFAPGAGNDVLLDTVGNRLFEVEVPIARDVIFQDIGGSGIRLFTSNATGNYFVQTSGGGIIGTGPLTIGGTATFLTNGSQPVQLAGFSNDFQGQVNATGDDIYLNDINDLDLGNINSGPSGLQVVAAGSVTNSGGIIIANTTPTFWTSSVTASTGSITMLNPSNDFNVLSLVAPLGSASVFDIDEILLRTSNVGVNLNVSTTGGAAHSITDDVGATITVGGLATFTAGAANVILDSATNNFNVVAVVSSNNAFLRDVNSMALNLLNATTNIKLQAGSALTDNNAGANNLNAPSAELIAATGVGSGNAIESTISSLAAVNSTSGNIELTNTVSGLLTITTVGGTAGVKNNGTGSVAISNNNSITVAADSNAGSAFVLNAQSPTPTDAENIVVNTGVTIQSDGLIDLNAADNFNIPAGATLVAVGNVTLDSLDDFSVDPLGSTFDFFGNVDAANIAFNGSNTEDTFNIQLDSVGVLTHMDVDGNDPTIPTLPGDVLNIIGANLTLIVNGVGTGNWTAPGAAVLDYVEIETVVASGPYHLIIDMGAAGLLPYNSVDAMLDGTPSNELEIRVDVDDDARAGFGGVLAFNGPVTNIRSLAVRGSASNEVFSITQNANNLLPGQTGGLNNSSPDATGLGGTFVAAGRTPNLSPPAIHFSGNGAGDADSLRFNLNLAEDVGYFAKGAGAGDVNVQGKMTVSFSSLEKFESDQFATGGSIVIDSSSYEALANLTITDLGSLTLVDGDNGFAEVEFQNAGTVTIRSGSGEDVIDLVSIDSAGLTSVTLDADNFTNTDNPVYIGLQLPTYFASDTIRVRSLPSVPALLLGGQGGDLFQLFNGSNQTSQILGPITINGEDGNVANTFVDNDRLFMIASGDVGPANVLVTETFVEGLTGFAGANDVTYSNIDYIDVTTTSGDDNITVDMDNGLSDMNIATVRGADGQDDFDVLGVENFVPNAPVRPKFTDLFLFGDGPDDQARGDVFGKNQDIFPSLTVVINIRGGAPSPVAPAGNIPGDTLFLDMSLTSANATIPVLVDTVGKPVVGVGYVGSATSASHKPVLFNDIETFDVNDRPFEGNTNSGQTNVQRGDLYVRGQESAADRIILYHENPPLQQSRLRYNNTDMSGFVNQLPTQTSLGKFIAYGRGGDDQITISNSLIRDGELYGQLGNDYLAGSTNGGNDLLVGASGNDRLQGLGGNDIMWGDNQDGTGNGSDRLNGGVGNDILYGGGGIDTMYGEAGDDLVRGEDGNDILSGDAGNDIVVGSDGNDRVNGGAGRDIVLGGQGVDIVDGDAGDDIVIGDATSWDLRTPANDAALRALLFGPGVDFWNSANLYAARVSNMRSLISGNVFEETVTAKDTILGDLETDWYWDVSLNDILSGKLAIEAVN